MCEGNLLQKKQKKDMSENLKIKGSEALIKALLDSGVDTMFGYPGGQVIPIYDALYDYKGKLNHILTRHEQGAVHAAQGYARATGKVGVCVSTSGPGATNLITGIADAMIDSTPLVCITGQVPTTMLGTDAFQEADIISMSMTVTKWSYQVSKAEDIAPIIAKAFYIASTGRPGPVLVDITKDAQVAFCDYAFEKLESIRSYTPTPVLDMEAIDRAAELINQSKCPFVLVGQGVSLSGASAEMDEFSKAGNLPMGTTLMGISAVNSQNERLIGNLGMHGNLAANLMTQHSDLIIAVGMRFSDRVTGNVNQYAPEAKIIHIDIDQAELGKNLRVDLPILADAKEALKALTSRIEAKNRDQWFGFVADAREREENEVVALLSKTSGITSGETIIKIAQKVKGDAVVVTDVGQNQMFAARYSQFNSPRSFITSGGLGTMGFGLPASMGAKFGVPEKCVIAVLGDGGFQMTMQELGTIMENKLGVKIVILNNSYLGMVRQWQELFFDHRYSFTEMANPNFTQLAGAYGIASRRVTTREDLESAINEMLSDDNAFLLEVVVEPEHNVFPMMPAGASLWDIMLSR